MKNRRIAIFLHVFFLAAFVCQAGEKKRIAVIDIASGIVDSRMLTDRLTALFVDCESYEVIERVAIDQILREQGFQSSGCTDQSCAVEIGQIAGVDKIVLGIAARVGSEYSLAVRMINVATGVIERAVTVDHIASLEDIYHSAAGAAVNELSREKPAWERLGITRDEYELLASSGIVADTIGKKPWLDCGLNPAEWLSAYRTSITCQEYASLRSDGLSTEEIERKPWQAENLDLKQWRESVAVKNAHHHRLKGLRITFGSAAAVAAIASASSYVKTDKSYQEYVSSGRKDAASLGDRYEQWMWIGRIAAGVSAACAASFIITFWF
jgi:hypothetical protein